MLDSRAGVAVVVALYFMVARSVSMLLLPYKCISAFKLYHATYNKIPVWRIVDGLSASGGDPIHVNKLTYFYDIPPAQEQAFTADRQILKDIMLANQELDILRRTDIMTVQSHLRHHRHSRRLAKSIYI
jgi:hypothetical protein